MRSQLRGVMGNVFLPYHCFEVFGHFPDPVATPLSPAHKPYGELGQPFTHHKCANPREKGWN